MQYTTTTLLRITKAEIVAHVQAFRKDIMYEFYQHVNRLGAKPDETALRSVSDIMEGITDVFGPLASTPTADVVEAMDPDTLKKEISEMPFYYMPVDSSAVDYLDRGNGGVVEIVNGDGTLFCSIFTRDLQY